MATGKALPTSRHFHLHELTDGIYAAIGIEGTGSGSNAGILDLGDRTLVFDSFLTPQAADDLRRAAEQLTGHPVSLVINSHWHADHIQGNQVFAPEATIIATGQTSEIMATRGAETIERYKARIAAHLQKLEAQLQQEQDEQKRAELLVEIGEASEIAECAPNLTLRLPNQTFEQRMVIKGSRRTAELLCYGGGHTASDAFLVIPEARLAFMGDLFFAQSHLWIGDGNASEWRRIIAEAQQLDLHTCVPGHGPISTLAGFQIVDRYLEEVEQIVSDALKNGTPAEQAAAAPMPAYTAGWSWEIGWSASIQTLIERARKE